MRLHEKSLSPGYENGLKIFSPVKGAEKPYVIAFKFQPELKYELGHAHRLSCGCKTLYFLQTFPAQF